MLGLLDAHRRTAPRPSCTHAVQGGKKDDDDEDDEEEPDDGVATAGGGGWIEEAERLDDPLRGALPMSFGRWGAGEDGRGLGACGSWPGSTARAA